MYKFEIEGGYPIKGSIKLTGGKNSVLPIIAATLLTDKPCILKNVPKILDVRIMLRILKELGGSVEYINKEDIKIENKNIQIHDLDHFLFLISKLRGSILLLSPLVYRLGRVPFIFPGGDRIGKRELSAHFDGFKQLGLNINFINGRFEVYGDIKNSEVFLYEPSVTATENLLMLSALQERDIVIENAACEPHVISLCDMLSNMGVKIEGVGSNILKIKGTSKLSGVTHKVLTDTVEIATYMIFSLMSEGEIIIKDIHPPYLKSILYVFEKFNTKFEVLQNDDTYDLLVPSSQNLYFRNDLGFNNLGIYTSPYPGFPTDLLAPMIILGTKVKGDIIFFEKMYEDRLSFLYPLKKIGVKFEFIDSNRVIIKGRSKIKACKLEALDIRSGVSYLAAMLAVNGSSTLLGVDHIRRGYQHIDLNLNKLGAHIVKSRQ
jgi:UDP-N-acetylglucosamine 1-carboxyvinyltransferase